MKRLLLLRADASHEIGVGHVMRCLALAQAWQDAGGEVALLSATLPASLRERLQCERLRLIALDSAAATLADADETRRLALAAGATWVVVDGYGFGPDYYEYLRAGGLQVLALDDMAHQERYPVDVLLNQNLSASLNTYAGKIGDATELLLGPHHSLLRREFRAASEKARGPLHTPRRVLVSFGGGDAENFTARILASLVASGRVDLEVVVLAGAANPHVASLHARAATAPFACEVRVSVENVAEVMAWADAAITAGGSTVWELASMALPALIGGCEDNQLSGLRALGEISFFRAWPVEELLARDLMAELDGLLAARPACGPTFDAHGASRVVQRLQALGAFNPMEFSTV
jgi:UDP-2,4-diacetamido-2,4,6-trideoxy-beta-L-altropyranose hydrolase